MHIEIVTTGQRAFWWRVKTDDGRVLLTSKRSSYERDARQAAADFVKQLKAATLSIAETTVDESGLDTAPRQLL